ncbi:MAG: PP2C family protein-serine/threonine phosphatase [Kouleothrix sp.]|nr:PP2C family protein-serine/threonine phosphatase [Kouleothrix sp.]
MPRHDNPPDRLLGLARRVWPALATLDEPERRRGLSEVVGLAYSLPLALAGLAWLSAATDAGLLLREWPIFALLAGLSALFSYLSFFQFFQRPASSYDWASSSLQPIVVVSAVLLFGPTAIWLDVATELISGAHAWRRQPLAIQRWNSARNRVFNIAASTLGFLAGLALYRRLGGQIPPPQLTPASGALALLAVLVALAIQVGLFGPYALLLRRLRLSGDLASGALQYVRFVVVVSLPPFAFAILAAAVYLQIGWGAYLFFMAGALLASLLAQRLSGAAERSGRRSGELAQLERLGRALIAAPPDALALPAALAAHVPAMFRYEQIEIRLASGQTLLRLPERTAPVEGALWSWLFAGASASSYALGDRLPWSERPARGALAVAPIAGHATGAAIGGIYLALYSQVEAPAAVLPALQSLAAQIASALHRAEEHARELAYQRVRQELDLAAQIQASFLPAALPVAAGWQFAAALEPARQTSGDFYDLIELPGGRLGLLVADVADKGTGAALFMALSRTLIRTYALEHPAEPEVVLRDANRRMLADAHTSMFVTAFYGVLETATGRLAYASAGHNPPYLLSLCGEPRRLGRTGIPLGIEAGAAWQSCAATVRPGDTLVLYTDGVSEAQNEREEFFEEERLLASVQGSRGGSAQAIQAALLAAVRAFAGAAPQSDDITVMVVVRAAE